MDSQSILELLYEDDVEFVDKIPMKPVGNTVSSIAVSTTSTAHTCTYTAVRYCSIAELGHLYWTKTK